MNRLRLSLFALVTCAIFGASLRAAPLDPNSFTSLGTLTLAAGSYTIDTSAMTLTGPGTNFNGVASGNIAVFCFASIDIAAGATITCRGSRCLALLSQSTINMAGILDGSGENGQGTFVSTNYVGGCGGGAGGLSSSGAIGNNGSGTGGGTGANGEGGAGGGGFATAGSRGGDGYQATPFHPGQPGGAAYGDLATLLEGGSGGGGGWLNGGGGGGGGIEVGATGNITIPRNAEVRCRGGNGEVANQGAAGGGSGGGVFVHSSATFNFGGILDVRGGHGGMGGCCGASGGGAGGRILVTCTTYNNTGTGQFIMQGGTSGIISQGTCGGGPCTTGGTGGMGTTGGGGVPNPANNPPTYTKGADQSSAEDAGAQTVAGWATAMNSNDSGQALSAFIVVGNTNPTLFATAPAVDVTTGTLTYTAAANANGAATIELVLQDVGQGANTSAIQTFVITITPVNDPPEIQLAAGSSFTGPTANVFTFTTTFGTPLSNATLQLVDMDSNIDITAVSPSTPTAGITPPTATSGNPSGTLITFTGTPSAAGTTAFTITIFDGTATVVYTVNIDVVNGVAPQITSTAITTATVGILYSYTITATGTPNPTLSVAGNPAWLTLTGNVLSGTPPAVGTAGPITITAANGVNPDATQVFSITIQPNGTAPAITSTAPTTGTVGVLYSYTATATGNPTPTISITGAPSWLFVSGPTMSGTPTAAGTYGPITVTASNGITPNAVQTFSITVSSGGTVGVPGGGGGGGCSSEEGLGLLSAMVFGAIGLVALRRRRKAC